MRLWRVKVKILYTEKMVGMAIKPYLSLILPAYNEAARIQNVLETTISHLNRFNWTYEIFVIADGNDGTRELAADIAKNMSNLHVMGEKTRRGKGYAIRQGVIFSQGEIIGFSDADGKTPIQEIDKVFPLFSQGYDMVIGSRGLSDSLVVQAQTWYRQLGSKGFAVFLHTVIGLQEIPDTQCGFKFFRRQVAQEIFKKAMIDGYMVDVEILFLAKLFNYSIYQIPVHWSDDRDSRLELIAGNIQNAIDVFKIRFNKYW